MSGGPVVVLISANSEWQAVKAYLQPSQLQPSPFGEWFTREIDGQPLVFVQGGWGKISAAASAQYAIDRWQPSLIINLGTCGGLAGRVQKGEVLLVEQTLVYDLIEQMTDPEAAIKFYSTDLDLSWLHPPFPLTVRRSRLLSADRDILAADIPDLIARYDAIAADWESGAIAWVTGRSGVRCLILRGVSDLVGIDGGEAYGNHAVFKAGTNQVMAVLLDSLPGWLGCCR